MTSFAEVAVTQEKTSRALDRGRSRGTGLNLCARALSQSRAFLGLVEEDVMCRDVELACSEEFLTEALADLAEADKGQYGEDQSNDLGLFHGLRLSHDE